MNKILILFLFFILSSYQLLSQILPKENSELNYRLIGFSFPPGQDVTGYKIEIAAGNYLTNDSFEKNIVVSLTHKINKIIAEVPAFGKQYTWRYLYTGGRNIVKSELHHFATGINSNVDTANFRLTITKTAEKYKDAYVFSDANKVLYDMNGRPVWYLPVNPNDHFETRDIRCTSFGTITFVIDNILAHEINYDGTVLWEAPNNGMVSGDSTEHYHHEFTRLSNGHYMVLGNERFVWNPATSAADSLLTTQDKQHAITSPNASAHKALFGTIMEYDQKGHLLWSWKSYEYFKGSDVKYFTHVGRMGGVDLEKLKKLSIDVHENAFYFDEKEKVIYLGFRDLSRIIKVKYPDGYVISAYGEKFKPNVSEKGNGLFCGQHALGVSGKGNLYLFNNNTCNKGKVPTLILMREPVNGGDELAKIWEYSCTEGIPDTSYLTNQFPIGGNITELPDQSFFASMSGGQYSTVFIVNQDKKIIWSARPEKWDKNEKKWTASHQYRANIIYNHSDLEKLVWGENK